MSETAKTKWYASSLDWVLVALLLVEGLLFLSDQYDWFAFNRRKGWTVLIAVAVVGGALLLTALWAAVSYATSRWTKHPPFQFGLRPVMLLVLAIAVVCGWFASAWNDAQTQRKVLAEFKGIIVRSEIDGDKLAPSATPVWLTKLLGVEFFSDVFEIQAGFTDLSDVIFPDGHVKYFLKGEEVEFPSQSLAALLLLPKLKKVVLMNMYPDSHEVQALKARGVEVELFMAW
jgi:hypothetical protein